MSLNFHHDNAQYFYSVFVGVREGKYLMLKTRTGFLFGNFMRLRSESFLRIAKVSSDTTYTPLELLLRMADPVESSSSKVSAGLDT